MLRSESNSSITQSPIGWQISNFLTMLHEPTCGMCVCTIRVCAACVGVCAADCAWLCAHAHRERVSTSHYGHLAPAAFHACVVQVCVCVSACVLVSHATCWGFLSAMERHVAAHQQLLFCFLSMEESLFCSDLQVCWTIKPEFKTAAVRVELIRKRKRIHIREI